MQQQGSSMAFTSSPTAFLLGPDVATAELDPPATFGGGIHCAPSHPQSEGPGSYTSSCAIPCKERDN